MVGGELVRPWRCRSVGCWQVRGQCRSCSQARPWCARAACCGAAPRHLALPRQTCRYPSKLLPAIPEHGNGFPGACRAEEGLGHSSARLSRAHSSWTEDTRAQIFSESPSGHGLPETPCEELERRIEGKLKEFEALAALGQQLVSEEHYLSATVRTGEMGSGEPSAPPEILWGQSLEERARCGWRALASGTGPAVHPRGCSGQEGVSPSNGC